MNKILVIVPCFNIERYVNDLSKIVADNKEDFDFLFVDDASSDDSLLKLKTKNLNSVSLSEHLGKASALKAGFKYAKEKLYKYVITMDGDMQHDPQTLKLFKQEVKNNPKDIFLAQRNFKKGNMPLSRILSNSISSHLISKLVGIKITDSQCGYRCFKVDKLSIETRFSGYQYESELLVKMLWNGTSIGFIDTKTIYNDSISSMRYFSDTFAFIKLFIHLFIAKRKHG